MSDEAGRLRAQARFGKITLKKTNLYEEGSTIASANRSEAVALAFELTKYSWAVAGLAMPTYSRATMPFRFVPRTTA